MLNKRIAGILMVIVMAATLLPVHAFAATAVQAAPGSSAFILNGAKVGLEAYNINNNNYVKLRDLAKALNGGARQFEVTWGRIKASDRHTKQSCLYVSRRGNGLTR